MSKKRHQLAIHTVFLPREELFFIKEWIFYHLHQGVDHFYLYDNSGSIGRDGSTPQINKRGFDFHSMTRGLSDVEIRAVLEAILDEFGSDIYTLVDWQPQNEEGQIIYGQDKSVRHCVGNYQNDVEWLATIDMDEFLISPRGDSIKKLLKNLYDGDCSRAVILQKKFANRYLHLDKYIIDIMDCIDGIDTSRLGPKNIFLTDSFDPHAYLNIHDIPIKFGATYFFDQDILRFNHYNASDMSFKYMQGFYKCSSPITLNATDESMRPYREVVHLACKTFGTPEWRSAIMELEESE